MTTGIKTITTTTKTTLEKVTLPSSGSVKANLDVFK